LNLEIPEQVLKRIQSRCTSKVLKREHIWGNQTVDHGDLDPSDLPLLTEFAEGLATTSVDARRLIRKIKQISVLGNGKKHHNLELLADEMRILVQKLPNRWVFQENTITAEAADPYLVTEIEYIPPRGSGWNYDPAHVSMSALAMVRGERKSIGHGFYREDMAQDFSAEGMFSLAGWMLETPELVAAYKETCNWYSEIRQKEGKQLIATGGAEMEGNPDDDDYRWWRRVKKIRLDRDGVVGRVVLDDAHGWKSEERGTITLKETLKKAEREEDEEENVQPVVLPEHPYVRCFDMRTHSYVITHAANVSEYMYNRAIFDRIVIPNDHKELIDALVVSGKTGDDLVAGKGKGVVILSSGVPGTGKTLTAEAYSERARKPLYSVQCSQLGLGAETLEKELAIVLERAMRWGAILLLDEADVYIRARGDDIAQNAVVGVFLRLLEYYTGVLFMTTNRSTLVDDAILSRCVVHVRYKVPDAEGQLEVWKLMLGLFCQMDKPKEELLNQLVETFPNVSPRTVKQLCRLARTMSERLKRPLDLKMFSWVARFQDLEKDAK
jgi:SpoVK/Ycf46/Vps4 family AAA+-type ATPase